MPSILLFLVGFIRLGKFAQGLNGIDWYCQTMEIGVISKHYVNVSFTLTSFRKMNFQPFR